jgi:hypothetical protein
MWSEIGWGLQTCKKPDGLIRVFKPLTQTFAENLISVFCRRKGRFEFDATLGENRKKWRSRVEQSRNAEALMQRSHEQLQRLDAALAQASRRQRESISPEREKWSREADRTAQEARRAREAEREQWARLQHLEATFAREELFQFLKSGRYSIEPFSLANAVAGLPYMGWRQSMKRCLIMPRYGHNQTAAVDGLTYQTFKAIRLLGTDANKKSLDTVVVSFREGILLLPTRHRQARAELAQNWFYLERALRKACKVPRHPMQLPFEIQKQYLKEVRSKSPVDIVLAESAEIELKRFEGGRGRPTAKNS